MSLLFSLCRRNMRQFYILYFTAFIYNSQSPLQPCSFKLLFMSELPGKPLAHVLCLIMCKVLRACSLGQGKIRYYERCVLTKTLGRRFSISHQIKTKKKELHSLIIYSVRENLYFIDIYCNKFAGSISQWKFITLQSSIHKC
jgi:hypothetical protein